jgi:DNA-binding SARP family transcriptional activator
MRVSDAGGRPVEIGARKRRIVLAALLAGGGRAVSTDTLVEAVWGSHPPASARRNVQLYAHQLRRILGADLVVARGDGYAIEVGDGFDAAEFRRLVADGGALLDAGDPVNAERNLRRALDLWQGQAFPEFLDCAVVADEARRLELLRLETFERWAEAQLVNGATPRLAVELAELCGHYPYRETLRAHLMRALYQTGRQAEALAVFRETRVLLVEQLGVEPNPALQRLHEAILRGDEHLEPAPRTEPPATAVPRELPPDPAVFTGREQALHALDQALQGPRRPVVISGMGGVGKTTLAVHWGQRVADRFPDGQLYLNLRGFAPGLPMRPAEAVGLLLRALGVPPARVPVDLDSAIGMYRTLLAGRAALIVLDNARDAEQVRPLLPASPGCLAVVTSRDRLTGLVARDGARRIGLDTLPPAEAETLVTRLLDGADPAAAAELARACGYLPLAIRIGTANLADRPGLTVAEYVESVRSDLDGLEVHGDPDASIRSAFSYSYHALDPPAARLFRLLGLVAGPDLTAPAAAALADTDSGEARRLLETLARAHLLEPGRPGRYALHDLLRAYASELAGDDPERKDATGRLHDFYLSAVDAAARLLYPRQARLPVEVPERFRHRSAFPDPAAATGWVDAELANLVSAAQHAATHGPHRVAWLLANSLGGYFWLRARDRTLWLAAAEAGLAAATSEGDRPALAVTQLGLAVAHRVLGRPAEAIGCATEALALSRQLGWLRGEAGALSNLGAAHAELGENQAAMAAFDQELVVSRELEGRAGEAGPLASRSQLRYRMGQLRGALADGLAALEIYRELPNPAAEARAQLNAALSYLYLGELEPAQRHITRSLELFESIGERYGSILASALLARLHIDASRYDAALEVASGAVREALDAEYHASAAVSIIDMVEARRQLGDHEHAVRDSARAVQLARRANHGYAEAFTRIGLADAYRHDRQLDRALASATAARRLTGRYGYRLLDGLALTVLTEIDLAAGDEAAAREHGAAALTLHRETGYRAAELRVRALLDRLVPAR